MSHTGPQYTGPQDQGGLVTNPRYETQVAETQGNDGRGPYQESRYGAAPLGTGNPVDTIRNPAAYGFKKDEPEGFRFPGTVNPRGQQAAGNVNESEFGKGQPGYGQPEFGAPSQGQNTGSLWPHPATPPNAHKSHLVGQGEAPRGGVVDKLKDAVGIGPNSGYRANEPGYDQSRTGYGEPGYDQPRREGIVDKAKDAVGVGPNSGNRNNEPGYDQGRTGYGEPGYNQPRREGIVDKAKDAVGVGPTSGYGQGQGYRNNEPGYDQGRTGYGEPGYDQPRREGIVDKAKDAVGVGPTSGYGQGQGYRHNEPGYDQSRTGYGEPGYDQPRREGIADKAKVALGVDPNSGNRYNEPGYDQGRTGYGQPGYDQPRREGIVDKAKDAVGVGPNVNHPSAERGFGGGLGRDEPGYNTGIATGADAYAQPRREGVVDKVKNAAGVGPNSGYDARTGTGHDAYVHGNHPAGQQDRIQGVNEPTYLGGQHGLGRNDGVLSEGEHVPQSVLGERRTEPGYDMSKGTHHLPGHGEHHTGTGIDGTERMRKGHEEPYDNKISGHDSNTEQGIHDTPTSTGYDDTTTGGAPPKKGLITKIKEKIHHTH